jgi:hypothetical protein
MANLASARRTFSLYGNIFKGSRNIIGRKIFKRNFGVFVRKVADLWMNGTFGIEKGSALTGRWLFFDAQSQAFSLGYNIAGFQPAIGCNPLNFPAFSSFLPPALKYFKKVIASHPDFDKLRAPRHPKGRQDSMFADR